MIHSFIHLIFHLQFSKPNAKLTFSCFSLVAPFNIIILSSSSSSSAQPLEFRSRLFVFIISDSQGHSITTKPLTALFPLKLLVTVQDSDRLWPGTLFFSFFPSFFFSRNLCGFSPQRPLGVWVCARCFLLILFWGGFFVVVVSEVSDFAVSEFLSFRIYVGKN